MGYNETNNIKIRLENPLESGNVKILMLKGEKGDKGDPGNVNVHEHDASAITSGTIPVARGGTGATTAAGARTNLGAAAEEHTHAASDITSGTVPVANGGTGASTASDALENLGAAAEEHTHSVTDLTDTLPVSGGGTGATTAAGARTNLGLGNVIAHLENTNNPHNITVEQIGAQPAITVVTSSTVNLNNYIDPGAYKFTNATTITNFTEEDLSGTVFYLFVYYNSSYFRTQDLQTPHGEYRRIITTNGTATNLWEKTVRTNSLTEYALPISDGGTGKKTKNEALDNLKEIIDITDEQNDQGRPYISASGGITFSSVNVHKIGDYILGHVIFTSENSSESTGILTVATVVNIPSRNDLFGTSGGIVSGYVRKSNTSGSARIPISGHFVTPSQAGSFPRLTIVCPEQNTAYTYGSLQFIYYCGADISSSTAE